MQHTLKAIRVLEYSYIPCAKYSSYLAVAVANLAAILDSRNYQEAVLHSLSGMGIHFANRHGVPGGQSPSNRSLRRGIPQAAQQC